MERDLLIKRASYASIITGIIILIIKILGWIKSDSIALFASLVDSLLDITSSCINAIAIQIALSPPDNNHRFGHNKVQDLAIFGQSVFFISSGAFTMFISLKKITQEHTIQNFEQGIISMALCTVLCLILVAYQSYVIKKTNSSIIKSDRMHYIADSASDVAVVVSIFGSQYFNKLDAILGIMISLYIIFSAIHLLKKSVNNLIDTEFSDQDKAKIFQILRNNQNILGVHELKTRYAGDKGFIQMHIDLEPNMSLVQAHHISEELAQELIEAFPHSEVIIHQDPLGHDKRVEHRENIK